MKLICSFLFSFLLTSAASQNFERLTATVKKDGNPMLSPWAGGVNAPQWSKADLNGDGKMDLYSFDRDGHKHNTYLNVGEPGEDRYAFAPEFLQHFPQTRDYVLLRDYNKDGVMDLFAYAGDEGIPGLKVYKGILDNGFLTFDRVEFSGFPVDVLTVTTGSGFITNLEVNRLDYSAVDDIDGDGDLDVLGIESTGGRNFVFYQNLSLEQGFTTDTLIFKKITSCWAGISIPTLTSSLTLSVHPDSCAPVFQPKIDAYNRSGPVHGAGTLCTVDMDNDGDKELLYGDLQFPQVILAVNGGTPEEAWANQQDSTFPSYDVPVNLEFFPASYILDMDNDGKRDFMVSPNSFGNLRDRNAVWYYRNTGTDEVPLFTKVRENMIERDMIDVGTSAQPVFIDYNQDGLMDFVVGNFSAWTPSTQPNDAFIQLYLNTGTTEEPVFELADDNLLNLNQLSGASTAFAPAFGDLDGDGDKDILIGESSGTVFFAENTAGSGNPFTWGPLQPGWQGIDVGQMATPFIHDVNKDGAPDLLIGNHRGTIKYFPNQGTATAPQFHPDPDEAPNNNFFGGISTQLPNTATGHAAPVVLAFDTVEYIITGSEAGFIEVYILDPDLIDTPGGPFEVVSESFGNLYEGTYSRITFANINNDNFFDALVGNHRGGLSLFTSPFSIGGAVPVREQIAALEFELYPNPASGHVNLRFPPDQLKPVRYSLFNPIGQLIAEGWLEPQGGTIGTEGMRTGLYLLRVQSGEKTGIKKVMIR